MAYEFLRKLFGTTKEGEEPRKMTYEELEAAIDADPKLNVVDIAGGDYVSKAKLDAKIAELKGVQEQLTAANAKIESFGDVDAIKNEVQEWKTKYAEETKRLETEAKKNLDKVERDYAEREFFGKYKFTSEAAKKGIMAEFREKDFKLDNGTFLGAEDYMKQLMESEENKGAFAKEDDGKKEGSGNPAPPQPTFAAGSSGGKGTGNGSGAAESPFHFNFVRQPKKE